MQKLIIPFRLPGMNELIEANRKSRYAGANLKAEWQAKIEWCIIGQKIKPVTEPVIIHYHYTEANKRRDLDNIAGFAHKVIQDALVSRKVLTGDGWRQIAGFSDSFEIGVDAQIEVIIKEATNET